MAVSLVDRAEVLVKHPFGGFAVHGRDKNDVTLVALHVFEVFYKEGLERPVPTLPVGLDLGIRRGHLVPSRKYRLPKVVESVRLDGADSMQFKGVVDGQRFLSRWINRHWSVVIRMVLSTKGKEGCQTWSKKKEGHQ